MNTAEPVTTPEPLIAEWSRSLKYTIENERSRITFEIFHDVVFISMTPDVDDSDGPSDSILSISGKDFKNMCMAMSSEETLS